jgi:formylglycine-generating enzyme required for sulfatase activity
VTDLDAARVQIDGVDVGTTPLMEIDVEAGEHTILISKDRYLSHQDSILVEGRSVRESFEYQLLPAWANIAFSSDPPGAEILVDGEQLGLTPGTPAILQGRREVTVKLAGHKAWQDSIEIIAGVDLLIPEIELEPADGLVFIRSNPSGASVTINGAYKGLTPLEVALTPGERHDITLFKAGYSSGRRSITTSPNQESAVTIALEPVTARVAIAANPNDAELYVNGEFRGPANQTIELMAVSQQIEIRRQGYVPYVTEFISRPGLDQAIRVTLKSLEQERLDQIKPVITTAAGQTLKLFYPSAFTMGTSRREAGRRPNETNRSVLLQRPFYFGLHEVTNGQYKQFKADHTSGTLQGQSMDLENQPVIKVSWNDAALYCNWLSARESLPPFYQVEGETVIGFNSESTGYRLPTEAEWEWIARTDGSGTELRFPWGDQLPPPVNAGNFADISTQAFLGEIQAAYNDNYVGTAPVGRFTANYHGVYDIAGNAAEWVNDFYTTVGSISGSTETDPVGPPAGEFHTIRGSSWAHGSITELRLSFRDYGAEPRDDLGFRIGRYLGE